MGPAEEGLGKAGQPSAQTEVAPHHKGSLERCMAPLHRLTPPGARGLGLTPPFDTFALGLYGIRDQQQRCSLLIRGWGGGGLRGPSGA